MLDPEKFEFVTEQYLTARSTLGCGSNHTNNAYCGKGICLGTLTSHGVDLPISEDELGILQASFTKRREQYLEDRLHAFPLG